MTLIGRRGFGLLKSGKGWPKMRLWRKASSSGTIKSLYFFAAEGPKRHIFAR